MDAKLLKQLERLRDTKGMAAALTRINKILNDLRETGTTKPAPRVKSAPVAAPAVTDDVTYMMNALVIKRIDSDAEAEPSVDDASMPEESVTTNGGSQCIDGGKRHMLSDDDSSDSETQTAATFNKGTHNEPETQKVSRKKPVRFLKPTAKNPAPTPSATSAFTSPAPSPLTNAPVSAPGTTRKSRFVLDDDSDGDCGDNTCGPTPAPAQAVRRGFVLSSASASASEGDDDDDDDVNNDDDGDEDMIAEKKHVPFVGTGTTAGRPAKPEGFGGLGVFDRVNARIRASLGGAFAGSAVFPAVAPAAAPAQPAAGSDNSDDSIDGFVVNSDGHDAAAGGVLDCSANGSIYGDPDYSVGGDESVYSEYDADASFNFGFSDGGDAGFGDGSLDDSRRLHNMYEDSCNSDDSCDNGSHVRGVGNNGAGVESGTSDDEVEVSAVVRPSKANPKKAAPRATDDAARAREPNLTGTAFTRKRAALTARVFAVLNSQVFGGRLPADLPILWNRKLLTTAGYAYYRNHKADRVELSVKVVDSSVKLWSTLAHELCHIACYHIDHVYNPPHGASFFAWGARVTQRFPSITVSTCHAYEVHKPFRWQCSGCRTVYGRHSQSIDPERQQCGVASCEGKLVFLGKFSQDGTPAKKAPLNAYAAYVRQHSSAVKKELSAIGSTPKGAVMRVLAERYKADKAAAAAANARPIAAQLRFNDAAIEYGDESGAAADDGDRQGARAHNDGDSDSEGGDENSTAVSRSAPISGTGGKVLEPDSEETELSRFLRTLAL